MKTGKKSLAVLIAAALLTTAAPFAETLPAASAADDISASMHWDTLRIGGGGFVSGIVTGKKMMYARTDVGGAYRYNYEKDAWEQLFSFISEADRGLLSVDAMAIDPSDDNTVYFLCGCAYFSAEKTVIFKTTDGGKTFTESDVTGLIQVHGNGNGRQMGESIAVDPDNPDIIYCGGDVYAGDSCLIKSTDGGKTWKSVKSYGDLGLYQNEIKWPTWTNNMRHALTNDEYYAQNGISCIYIWDGKVYVGSSSKGKYNVVCAKVSDDKFTDMSAQLDADNIPGRITGDGQGNLFFAFQGAVQVGNGASSGSVKKLDTRTGTVTDISPLKHLYIKPTDSMAAPAEGGYSGISTDPANPNHMVCSTCGLFANAQLWQPWDDEHGPCWGDKFFKSEDGGETWIETTPGISPVWGQDPIADYLDEGGYAWIRDKAIHWVGSYVIDPAKPDRSLSTSGNGVFMCSNTWADVPQFSFHPDGIEEVVSLDFVSTADGLDLSAIGDYDGFVHESPDKIPPQYQPNMGSTSAIAVCPQNTDVWARTANGDGNNTGSGYYTTDRGQTWNVLKGCKTGGKLAITELSAGKYRIINADANGTIIYTDDFGGTWKTSSGVSANKGAYPLVDPNDPKIVYASGATHNDYWSSDMTKTEPTLQESHYSFYISTDYGATFTETVACPYGWESVGMYTNTGDLAYVSKGVVALAGGIRGIFVFSDNGTKKEEIPFSFAKCIGYGAPEKSGGPNTLYVYGKPEESDPEGIYRSTDAGKTWVCINKDKLYGGTGNGNYLVGDMNEFGKVYMSTVGCGIVYGELAGSQPPVSGTTTTTKTTTTTTTTTTSTISNPDILWGDATCSSDIDVSDAVLIARFIAEDTTASITAQGKINADVSHENGIDSEDIVLILKYIARLIPYSALEPQ